MAGQEPLRQFRDVKDAVYRYDSVFASIKSPTEIYEEKLRSIQDRIAQICWLARRRNWKSTKRPTLSAMKEFTPRRFAKPWTRSATISSNSWEHPADSLNFR
ncbi:hypothetical protein LB505_009475 [Fusarium chuoi]|nr:hypothetical protein LB505_009475 [Fusarium chuoi]